MNQTHGHMESNLHHFKVIHLVELELHSPKLDGRCLRPPLRRA